MQIWDLPGLPRVNSEKEHMPWVSMKLVSDLNLIIIDICHVACFVLKSSSSCSFGTKNGRNNMCCIQKQPKVALLYSKAA